jgi:hypothetical protein
MTVEQVKVGPRRKQMSPDIELLHNFTLKDPSNLSTSSVPHTARMAQPDIAVTSAQPDIAVINAQPDMVVISAELAKFHNIPVIASDRQILDALAAIRGDIADICGDIADIRGDITDIRTDIANIRTDMSHRFGQVNARF